MENKGYVIWERWKGTRSQWEALNAEAENLSSETPDFVHEELSERHCTGY
jgi:hypothetical protein